ncbi:MAG: hypothetical protein ACYC5O_00505 [Anaerolineae bacterium]
MYRCLLMLLALLAAIALAGCGATPVAAPAPTATPLPESTATTAATVGAAATGEDAVIEYRRSGGIAGVNESWTIYGDGQVVDVGGVETHVDAAAVAAVLEQAQAAGFYDQKLSIPKMSACRDCFSYQLAIRAGGQENRAAFEDTQEDVSPAMWDLLAAVQGLVEAE